MQIDHQNVFTKVIRVSNHDSLGTKIVVQGGTFENDAVYRAMEKNMLGRGSDQAPYPRDHGCNWCQIDRKEQYERRIRKK